MSRYHTSAIGKTFEKSSNFAGIRKTAQPEFLHSSRAVSPNRICSCIGGGGIRRIEFAIEAYAPAGSRSIFRFPFFLNAVDWIGDTLRLLHESGILRPRR